MTLCFNDLNLSLRRAHTLTTKLRLAVEQQDEFSLRSMINYGELK